MAIGGGTGLSVLLRGLRRYVARGELGRLDAVVTVADDGGSSGRLRRELGMPPPGDIRSCIAALADDEDLLTQLFQYRFPSGEGLSGHSFGNLFLAAMAAVTGDFYQAIVETERILSVRGRILPATLSDVRLRARGESGRVYEGESAVGRAGERLVELELEPEAPGAFPGAVAAIAGADAVVLGPGSLYTSVLPNLLIPDIRKSLRETKASVLLPLNLMTQKGETEGMTAADHLAVLHEHVGIETIDVVLVHGGSLAPERLAPYRAEGAEPLVVEEGLLASWGVEVLAADLATDEGLVRHDSSKLAGKVMELVAPLGP